MKEKLTPYLRKLSHKSGISKQYLLNTTEKIIGDFNDPLMEDLQKETGLKEDNRPRLLSDNGSCYVSNEFSKFIDKQNMGHVRGAPYHPQTQGFLLVHY